MVFLLDTSSKCFNTVLWVSQIIIEHLKFDLLYGLHSMFSKNVNLNISMLKDRFQRPLKYWKVQGTSFFLVVLRPTNAAEWWKWIIMQISFLSSFHFCNLEWETNSPHHKIQDQILKMTFLWYFFLQSSTWQGYQKQQKGCSWGNLTVCVALAEENPIRKYLDRKWRNIGQK